MKYFLFFSLATLGVQMASPQVLRPPFNLLNRPVPETFIETNNFLPAGSPTVISEPPLNSLVPIPNVVSEPSTTIITDCSPTICKNLANTIQLMIVCNLLQNSKGSSELALQLAAPIINEVMASPTLSCGCNNPLSPSVITPNLISPSVLSPNLISPNVISPLTSNIIGPNGVPLSPRVVSPAGVCPNTGIPSGPLSQVPNTSGLLNTLMGLLGNIKG